MSSRRWCITDLVIAPETGRISESRLWSNIGKALIVWLVIRHSEDVLSDWAVLFVLFGLLVSPELVKVWLKSKAENDRREIEREGR